MAAHAGLKNEFTEDENYHNLMSRLNWYMYVYTPAAVGLIVSVPRSSIACAFSGCLPRGSESPELTDIVSKYNEPNHEILALFVLRKFILQI